jgi:hypothetical protein
MRLRERIAWLSVTVVLMISVTVIGVSLQKTESRVSYLEYQSQNQTQVDWDQFYLVDEEIDALQSRLGLLETFVGELSNQIQNKISDFWE